LTIIEPELIPLWKRVIIRLLGEAFAYRKDSLEYYIGYCPKHGYYLDHLRGYDGKLSCPICLEERTKELLKK